MQNNYSTYENATISQIEAPPTNKMVNFTGELQVNLSKEEDLVKLDADETTRISPYLSVETTETAKSIYYKPFEVWFVTLFQKQQVL